MNTTWGLLHQNFSRDLMVYLFFGVFFLLISACSDSPSSKEIYDYKKSVSFLKLFPSVHPPGLHVYSPSVDPSNDDGKYQGKKIDPDYHFLLVHGEENPLEMDTLYHYYACYQFKLSEQKTALLMRCPSQYSETAVRLYIWENKLKKVSESFTLADAFGDEGWHFVTDAWIKDVNEDKQLDLVFRRKDYDMNLDDPGDINRFDTTYVYLGTGTTFKQSDFKVNPAKYPLKYWTE